MSNETDESLIAAYQGAYQPAWERGDFHGAHLDGVRAVRNCVRAALLQQQQPKPAAKGEVATHLEPVAWMYRGDPDFNGTTWRRDWEVTTDLQAATFRAQPNQPVPLIAHPAALEEAGFEAVRREACDPRPLADWHEDMGDCLWWRFSVEEAPYVGCPRCSDWPGYHTHWTAIIVPNEPLPASGEAKPPSDTIMQPLHPTPAMASYVNVEPEVARALGLSSNFVLEEELAAARAAADRTHGEDPGELTVDLPPAEAGPQEPQEVASAPAAVEVEPEETRKPRRARRPAGGSDGGRLVGDDPATQDVNEAYEQGDA